MGPENIPVGGKKIRFRARRAVQKNNVLSGGAGRAKIKGRVPRRGIGKNQMYVRAGFFVRRGRNVVVFRVRNIYQNAPERDAFLPKRIKNRVGRIRPGTTPDRRDADRGGPRRYKRSSPQPLLYAEHPSQPAVPGQ